MFSIEAIKTKINLAIGPITQKSLIEKGIEGKVSEIYTTNGMLESLIQIKKQYDIVNTNSKS